MKIYYYLFFFLLITIFAGFVPGLLKSLVQVGTYFELDRGAIHEFTTANAKVESKILDIRAITFSTPAPHTVPLPIISQTPEKTNQLLTVRDVDPSELSKTHESSPWAKSRPYWLLGLVLFIWFCLALWFVISQVIMD